MRALKRSYSTVNSIDTRLSQVLGAYNMYIYQIMIEPHDKTSVR